MNSSLFSDAMSIIDISYIEEAATYRKESKTIPWGKLCTIAACFACLILSVALVIAVVNRQNHSLVTENEPKVELTLNEAMNDKKFGVLFPKKILAGYVLEDKPGIFGVGDNAVLRATFYNYELEDEMVIRIALKTWFISHEKESIESNAVKYRSERKQDGSYIYVESEDFIIAYSFSTRDIAQIEEFRDMVNSAEQTINYK